MIRIMNWRPKLSGDHVQGAKDVSDTPQPARDFLLLEAAAFAVLEAHRHLAPLRGDDVRVLVTDVHAFVVGQDEVHAGSLRELLASADNGSTARRREEAKGRVASAGGRGMDIDDVVGWLDELREQDMGNAGGEIALRIARKRVEDVARILIHRRPEELVHRQAMLDAESQWALNRYGDDRSGELRRVELPRSLRDDGDAVRLVAMNTGAEVHHRTGRMAAHHHDGDVYGRAVGQLSRA
jgi:hypothetical protein